MPVTDQFQSILERQRLLTKDLEAEYEALANSDLTKENTALKEQIAQVAFANEEIAKQLEAISAENRTLKSALHAQIYNERMRIIDASKGRSDLYFKGAQNSNYNRLIALETSVKKKIDEMTDTLRNNNISLEDELYAQLDDLTRLLNKRVTEAKEEYNRQTGIYSQNEQAEFETLKQEQLGSRVIQEIAKKNSFESFIGLNLINKLGILLIVLGVIVATQYTYFTLPDMLKGILAFALGGVMLVAGELLSRKKPTVFSLGLTAGGVAVLYVALVSSYFFLEIMGMYTALGLCVLITAGAFLLATRYNAQVILAFALVGGYLPILSIDASAAMVYSAMAYFVVLNLFALLVSRQKKWIISAYIGLVLNIAGTVYLTLLARQANTLLAISYVLFAFLVYTFIPIFSNKTQKSSFKTYDLVLLAINTVFSSLILYFAFSLHNLADYYGGLALLFAAIYLALGRYLEAQFPSDSKTSALFYLTGFTFVVLVVPFQFGKAWLSLGWLVEGVALTVYGILRDDRHFKRVGLVIDGLCIGAFVLVDLLQGAGPLFPWKYLAITLGSLLVLGSLVYKKSLSNRYEKAFRYAVVLNLWLYCSYLILSQLPQRLQFSYFNTYYLCNALAIVITFLLAYTAPRIKILCDAGMKIVSMGLYILGILWLWLINGVSTPFFGGFDQVPLSYTILGSVLLFLIGILSVLAVYECMRCIVMERKASVEWFPFVVSTYFVGILTQNLIGQYHLSFASAVISILYVITALAWIILGFIKRYAFLRRFGLGLSVLSVAKLFLVDLSAITTEYQMVSYFALGITLVAISLVYQYFNKRLELNIGEIHEEPKPKP